MNAIYAHTLEGAPVENWEPLYGPDGHAERTAAEIVAFRIPFSEKVCAPSYSAYLLRLLALSHDMGKAKRAFQNYLLKGGGKTDHKTPAAKWWRDRASGIGLLMAHACYGHHSGLCESARLMDALDAEDALPPEVLAALPDELQSDYEQKSFQIGQGATGLDEKLFSLMMALRMMHSCLIDADWLATEGFMEPESRARRAACEHRSMGALSAELESYIRDREACSSGKINELRKLIHHSCYGAAAQAPGVFRLNVPTGGGKSLSSLSFSLRHAELHGHQRVIYVIPYTSIIDQTAREFRALFGEAQVVEHHCNISEEVDSEDNRYATENWDAPVIITTAVQFFESLFACKNSRCRKIHNIANSVIVFDEAQSLPVHLLRPCLLAMKTLQRDYNCSLVLCTATQPALHNREEEGFDIGWASEDMKSLLGEDLEARLAQEMKRVEVEFLGTQSEEALVEHFIAQGTGSALFIVNLTGQAQHLFELLNEKGVQGLYHLSARMCPAHRVDVLREVRERLRDGLPTVLVATRVVEAGVDISFPIVYRDKCGLDSLAQAAGRCNRHGELTMGRVYHFQSSEFELPASFVDLKNGVYAMGDVFSALQPKDVFAPEAVEYYFRRFYHKRKDGSNHWDSKNIVNELISLIAHVKAWNFPEIARRFRFIEQEQQAVIVPYGEAAEQLRAELLALDRLDLGPSRSHFRRLQSLTVSVYSEEWARLRAQCDCIHRKAGIWMLSATAGYDSQRGLLKNFNTDYIL